MLKSNQMSSRDDQHMRSTSLHLHFEYLIIMFLHKLISVNKASSSITHPDKKASVGMYYTFNFFFSFWKLQGITFDLIPTFLLKKIRSLAGVLN